MWQSLTEQLGLAIPVIMILLSLVLPVAAAFFYFRHIAPGLTWQRQLGERIHKLASLKGSSIIHVQELRKILVTNEDTCMRPRVELLIEDSKQLYNGRWLPEPESRIQPEHLHCPGWSQIERSAPAALIAVAGTVITALLATALWLYDPNLISELKLLRILIVLPIVIGLLLSIILAKAISTVQIAIKRNWNEMMLQLRRKFPVYSSEHETATLINGFVEYDREMKDSVAQLTEQISHFSSQQLTDAITASVRTVMERTVSEPVTASYDKMTELAESMKTQLEIVQDKLQMQVTTGQEALNQLYLELMTRQNELLSRMSDQLASHHTQIQNENIEALENLTQQHADSMRKLNDVQQQNYKNNSDMLKVSLDDIASTYTTLLEQHNSAWQTALSQLEETEQNTLELLSERQSSGVAEMLKQTSDSIAAALNDQIAPVAQRLGEAADVLSIAHEYADTVQKSLESQQAQSIEAQNKMIEAATQLSHHQQTFASDVKDLKTSTAELTTISSDLNEIFSKNQADLLQTVETFGSEIGELSGRMREVIDATAGQHEQIITMSEQVSEVNQKQIDAVNNQINHLSDELSTRIDQLLLGFGRMTEDMLKQVNDTVQNQNDTLGSSLRSLTGTMEEEARSMSLYSQQITMEITALSDSLKGAVGEFDHNIRDELSQVLEQLDKQVADILSRLTYTASELADAVDALPQALGSGK